VEERRAVMHGMKEIIEEAESLPIEERTAVIDSLLKTINAPIAEIDAEWIRVAKRRLSELREGKVRAVSGNEVFSRISNRFEK
jgi:hypothetical protein